MTCIARNQTVGGSLVLSKIVLAVSEVWRRQLEHWKSLPRLTWEQDEPPHFGQRKPLGQRKLNRAVRHCSSVPYSAWKAEFAHALLELDFVAERFSCEDSALPTAESQW
jgi:hypothetical protein